MENKFQLYCDFCNFKQILDSKETGLTKVDQASVPMRADGSNDLIHRKQAYKCPGCGRAIRLRPFPLKKPDEPYDPKELLKI